MPDRGGPLTDPGTADTFDLEFIGGDNGVDTPESSLVGDVPGDSWLALGQTDFGKLLDITLVESEEIGTVGVGEAVGHVCIDREVVPRPAVAAAQREQARDVCSVACLLAVVTLPMTRGSSAFQVAGARIAAIAFLAPFAFIATYSTPELPPTKRGRGRPRSSAARTLPAGRPS